MTRSTKWIVLGVWLLILLALVVGIFYGIHTGDQIDREVAHVRPQSSINTAAHPPLSAEPSVRVDPGTGCQYPHTGFHVIPRTGVNGRQIGCHALAGGSER